MSCFWQSLMWLSTVCCVSRRSLCILQYVVYIWYGIYLHKPGNCIVVFDLRGLHPVSASTEWACLLHEDTVIHGACVFWCLWLEQSSGTDCLCPRIHSSSFFLVFISFNFPSSLSLFILETVLVDFCPRDWKAIPSPIFSLCFIWSFFLCLAVWLHASWQGICPQVFIDQSLAFLCIYPSIHPSIQPVFASPPRWPCFGWTKHGHPGRVSAWAGLRPDPAQAASASSLSFNCKTHQLLVSCAYNTYCLSGITWSLFVYDLLFNFCFLSFQ